MTSLSSLLPWTQWGRWSSPVFVAHAQQETLELEQRGQFRFDDGYRRVKSGAPLGAQPFEAFAPALD